MNAITRFSTWGHSLAVRIPTSLAREARIVDGASAELSVVNGTLLVVPIDKAPEYRITDLVAGITDENRHGEISGHYAQGNEFS
jgi:antitoxin MazE